MKNGNEKLKAKMELCPKNKSRNQTRLFELGMESQFWKMSTERGNVPRTVRIYFILK